MKFAIIAAGQGSRLMSEGVELPKPLVKLNGVSMIDRLVKLFEKLKAEEIVIIINDLYKSTEEHLHALQLIYKNKGMKITIVGKSTPSSMHSFYEISPYLKGSKFCLTTVDTIFNEEDFTRYIRYFEKSNVDALMAVTDYIDDESPLYVSINKEFQVLDFFDDMENKKYISGGIYCFSDKVIDVLNKCVVEGKSRMRNFQRALITEGLNVQAFPFSKIIDVDHSSDIEKAEKFLFNNA